MSYIYVQVDSNELTNWRRTRNKFVHDNYKIPPTSTKTAKNFFDAFETQLTDVLQQIEEGTIDIVDKEEESEDTSD